jgi:4-hydroxy-3-methylbut-2-en-1-yl diphosphate synthase IspG/GcpE
LQQITELTTAGCQIVRVAVPSQDDAGALATIARKIDNSGIRRSSTTDQHARSAGQDTASRFRAPHDQQVHHNSGPR